MSGRTVIICAFFGLLYVLSMVTQRMGTGTDAGRVPVPKCLAFIAGSRDNRVYWSSFTLQMALIAFLLVYLLLAVIWGYESLAEPGIIMIIVGLTLRFLRR